MALFKKNIVVGVSVSPELGLEAAQIDFATRTVLKYGKKQVGYDNLRKEIADLDLFKEALADLLVELAIPRGSDIVLNLPSAVFEIADFPASIDDEQVEMALEEELQKLPLFQNTELTISAAKLPISTMQNSKIAYTAAQKTMLIEIALQIKSLGYNLVGIDTSVNASLNALVYNGRVQENQDSWVLLIVENNVCRVIPMIGNSYADSFEEKIAIGEVLGDAENYETVVTAVTPFLKNLPSSRLYVLSKTSVINAKTLAEKLTYAGQIVHHNDNIHSEAPYLELSPNVDETAARYMSLDIIGAAISRDFQPYAAAPLNMFNASLGEVYENEQPLVIKIGGKNIVLSLENMLIVSGILAIIAAIVITLVIIPIQTKINANKTEEAQINKQIADIETYLKQHPGVSTDSFDEGDEVKLGLVNNKNIYTYYTIVGTEIPTKLWLTSLELGKYTIIEGQADNLESIYSFYRNIKEYKPNSEISLQKLGLASKSRLLELADNQNFDTESIITSMNADFYEFRISDAPEIAVKKKGNDSKSGDDGLTELPDLGE